MILIILMGGILFAQPDKFKWNYRHCYVNEKENIVIVFNYISDAKNQKEHGPCGAFAAIAAVEAIAQIYFNKTSHMLDLSESWLYHQSDTECPAVGCSGVNPNSSLEFIKNNGAINDSCFPFPKKRQCDSTFCYCNCDSICDNPDYKVFIPYFSSIQLNNYTELKKSVIDNGPVIVNFESNIGCSLHPDYPDCNVTHSILIIGWETEGNNTRWWYKDSWPSDPYKGEPPRHGIFYFYDTLNIFNYKPTFYIVYPVYNNIAIYCTGSHCSLFSSRYYVDNDGDGFYNWGFDTQPKPAGCPGPDKMDFDDGDSTIIFRVGYEPLPAPQLTGPSYVCSQQRTFTLHNVPSLFLQNPDSIEWEVTPSVYFDTPRSGKGDTVVNINPYPGYMGKQGEIKFTLRHNGKVEYKRSFIITGPREDLVSISVIDSYGGSPPKYGDIYYICPNTIYHIYYNNYDSNCSTWDYDWVLPYGWSEYWRYGNMISVNTNDYPYGMLEVWGKTCCESQSQSGIKLKTQYFYDYYECGEYFMAFPNPANSYVDIDINREKMAEENIRTDARCTLTLYDKTGLVKYKTEFRGFPFRIETVNLPEGVYLINLLYDGRIYSMRIVIKH